MRGGAAATGESSIDTSWRYIEEEDNTTLKEFIETYWKFTNNTPFFLDQITNKEYKNIIKNLRTIAGDQYTGSLIVIQNYILGKLNEGVDKNDIAENLAKFTNIQSISRFIKDSFKQIIIFTEKKNEIIRKLKQEMNTDTPTLAGLTDAHSKAEQGETIMETNIQVGTNLKGNRIESEKSLLQQAKDKINEFEREITRKKDEYKKFTKTLENAMDDGDSLETLTKTLKDAQNIELYGESIKIDEQVFKRAKKKIADFEQDIEKKKKELEGLINQEMEKENPDLETLKQTLEKAKNESILHGESIGIDDLITQLNTKILAIDDAEKLTKHKQSLQEQKEQQAKILNLRRAKKRQEAKQKREERERRIERYKRKIVSAASDFKKNELINAIQKQIDSNDIDGMIEAYENAINVGTNGNPFSPKKRIEVEIDPTILEEKKKIIKTKIKEQFENDFDKETILEEMRNKIQKMEDDNRFDRYFVDVKKKCIEDAEQKLNRAKDEAEAERKAQQAAAAKAEKEAAAAKAEKEAAAAKAKAEAELLKSQKEAAASKAQVKEQETTTEPTIEQAARDAAIAVAAAAAAVVKKIASDSINGLGSSKVTAKTESDYEKKAEDPDTESKEEGDDEEIDPFVKEKTKEAAAQVAIAVAAAAAAATKAIATKAIANNESLAAEEGDDKDKKRFIVASDGSISEKGTGNSDGTEFITNCGTKPKNCFVKQLQTSENKEG